MSAAHSWYDIMVTEEDRLLELSLEDWNAEKRSLAEVRGWAFVNRIDYVRRTLWHAKKDSRPIAPEPLWLGFYKDIADEPWKYGDDAFKQWLALDNALPDIPGRWRVAAYWARREEEEVNEPARQRLFDLLTRAQAAYEAKVAAATKIQALVRGHQLRCSVRFMDCAECLQHGVAPHEVEGRNLCRTCFDTLGWNECIHCGMPVHADYLAEFSGCCSRECMAEVVDLDEEEDADEWRPCEACGVNVHAGDFGNYRLGYWCSRACAYG